LRQGADSSSGSIQPHGVLLALDPDTLKVVQVAGEIQGMLGLAPAEILGRGLEARIGPAAIERLRMLAGQNVPIPRPIFVFETVVRRDGKILDAVVHLSDGVLVVELEPRLGESHVNPLTLAQGMITRVQDGTTLPAFLDAIAGEVRALMGFDRVMVYQFEPDDSGVVIAEAKIEALDPFLGLHYPASDIPQQARALYLRNWARLIPDARYTPAPITPTVNPITGRPLDLSFSTLRSVSPLHLEYLGNMGVVASMSLSLVVEGKLWGLIACHHREAKYLPHALRSVCELFAQMMSLQLGEKIAKAEQVDRLRAKRIHGELVEAMVREESVNEALIHNRPNLADYIPSEGVAIWWDGEATLLGHTPTEDQIRALVVWLNDEVPEGVFMTDCLSERFPPASAYSDAASGLIALSVCSGSGLRLSAP
jgi:chemotaxis family two-component system sensor kinase Cph1